MPGKNNPTTHNTKLESLVPGCIIILSAVQMNFFTNLPITTAVSNIQGSLTEKLKANYQLYTFATISFGFGIIQEIKGVIELPISQLTSTEYTESKIILDMSIIASYHAMEPWKSVPPKFFPTLSDKKKKLSLRA